MTTPPVLSVTRFVAFGDSITWGEDGDSGPGSSLIVSPAQNHPAFQFPFGQTYPGGLQQQLAARYTKQSPTVSNQGKPGEFAGDSGTRARFSSVLATGQFDVVLLMEGSNDLGERDAAIEPSVIDSLHQMLADAKSRGVRPYLATVPPMNPLGFRGRASDQVAEFNGRIRALAVSDGVTLVDVFQALNTDVNTFIGFDGLHPSAAGYAKIADTFLTAIKQTLDVAAPAGAPAVTNLLRSLPAAPRVR